MIATAYYRGFRIVRRGHGHYTIHGDGFTGAWAASLEQAMIVIDEIRGAS